MRMEGILAPAKLGLFIWIISLHSGEQMTTSQRNSISEYVKDVMACKNIPGLIMSVVHGQDVMTDGFGVADLGTSRRVDNKTLFCIGSITKGFTAAVVGMVLEKDSRYSWDTPISKILGSDFRLSDEFRSRYLTIKDLLAHRTGIPGYFGGLLTGYTIDRDTLVSRLRYMTPTHHVHSKYLYNNHMYMLAGYVAEKIAGKTWEKLTREFIFDKLGMTSSTFVKDLGSRDDVAKSHVSIDGMLHEIKPVVTSMVYPAGPAGSICSTSEDMTKWLQFQLKKSVLPSGERLMNETTFDAMHTPHMPTPLVLGKKILKQPIFPIAEGRFAYDLGWGSGMYRGYHNLIHSGELAGFMSTIWLIPDAKIGIFTSTNGPVSMSTRYGLRVIHHYISDILLGLDPWLNASAACAFPDPWLSAYWKKSVAEDTDDAARIKRGATYMKQARPLSDFEGKYGHLAFGNVTIEMNKDDKKLHLYHGRYGHAILTETSNLGEFRMRFVGDLLFVSVADGWKHTYRIQFKSSDGKSVDRLFASFIEGSAPPEFIRGKQWSEHETLSKNTGKNNAVFNPCPMSGATSRFNLTLYSILLLMSVFVTCSVR